MPAPDWRYAFYKRYVFYILDGLFGFAVSDDNSVLELEMTHARVRRVELAVQP